MKAERILHIPTKFITVYCVFCNTEFSIIQIIRGEKTKNIGAKFCPNCGKYIEND